MVLASANALGVFSCKGLMGPVVVVVDQILEQFVGEVIEIVEGCALDDVLVEGPPEAFDLTVGLRADRAWCSGV